MKQISLFLLLAFTLFLQAENQVNDEKKESAKPMFEERIEVVGRVQLQKTTQSVTVVKVEESQDLQLFSLKESFTVVPGILHLNTGHPGQLGYLYIRGSSPNQTILAINGVPLFDSASSLGIDLGYLGLDGFDRIEVLRGPLSNYLGSSAMGGVVNLASSRKSGLGVSLKVENNSSIYGGIRFGGQIGALKSNLFFESRSLSYGFENDRFKGISLNLENSFKFSDHEAGINFFTNLASSGIPFNGGRPSLNRNYQRKLFLISFPAEIKLSQWSQLKVNLSWQRHLYQLEDSDSIWSPYYHTAASRMRFRADYTYQKSDFALNWSADYATDTARTGEEPGHYSFEKTSSNYASSINLVYQTGNLIFNSGIRFDKYQQQDIVFSPQAGFKWNISSKMIFQTSFSESFRAPQLLELYNPFWGNRDLLPEKAQSFEATTLYFLGRFQLGLTYFYSHYRNLIGYSFALKRYDNISKATIAGIELNLQTELFRNFRLLTAFNYLYSRDFQYDRELLRRPKFNLNVVCSYQIQKIVLNAHYVYVGKRLDYNEVLWSVDRSPAYNYLNLGITYKFSSSLQLMLKISNLFDEQFEEVMGYPAPKRRLSLGFRYQN